MTPRNSYATLQEYMNYIASRNGTNIPTDPADDAVIENLLEWASRLLDSQTGGRHFYPRIVTRYLSPYSYGDSFDRELAFGRVDLLEVITFLNGDGTSIASTQYNLSPRNDYPKYSLRVKPTSTLIWEPDSDGNYEDALAITAIEGYHTDYANAWRLATTAAEAMDASETDYSVTSGLLFEPGQLIRFDNEFGYVSSKAADVLTITRGENGSTATTHLTGINIYIWQPMEEARGAVLEIAHQSDANRTGQSVSNTATVTAGGVVLQPRDIPAKAQMFINTHRRYT